jgi:hypothetical protein
MIQLSTPARCRVFRDPARTLAAPMDEMFELAHTFNDRSQCRRYPLVCRGCAQHDITQCVGETKRSDGHGPSWVADLPVEGPNLVRAIQCARPTGLCNRKPVLTRDSLSGSSEPKPVWHLLTTQPEPYPRRADR